MRTLQCLVLVLCVAVPVRAADLIPKLRVAPKRDATAVAAELGRLI